MRTDISQIPQSSMWMIPGSLLELPARGPHATLARTALRLLKVVDTNRHAGLVAPITCVFGAADDVAVTCVAAQGEIVSLLMTHA